jgi:hypothetical protein
VEDLWFDLLQKPERLRNHDPYQRPLVCFLTVLAARAVVTHFRKLRTRLPVASPEDWRMPQAPDTAADLDALADRWQEVVRVLDKEGLAFLLRMQRKRKRKQAEQKRYERMIHKLRRHFGLA